MSNYKRNLQAEQFYKALRAKKDYPIGTLAYYGPDDRTITKITVGILPSPDDDPILKHWHGNGIADQPETISEIGKFFQTYGVNDIVMTTGVIGCPHIAGEDYPAGGSCPECTFWREKQ